MQLKGEQLAAHLERTLAPVYVAWGDEPLLVVEATDAIRAAARRNVPEPTRPRGPMRPAGPPRRWRASSVSRQTGVPGPAAVHPGPPARPGQAVVGRVI